MWLFLRRTSFVAVTVAVAGWMIHPAIAQDLGGTGTIGTSGSGGADIGTPGGNDSGAAGGGSMADFSQLMQLIQQTIEPDTWDTLGGPSTMFPYAAGIVVDASGTIRDADSEIKEDVAADIKMLLFKEGAQHQSADDDVTAWRMPSKLRCVSLKGLLDEYARRRASLTPSNEAMLNLAGLSRVQFVAFNERDIVLAGPVGGVEDVDGHFRDRRSGMATMRLDGLASCFAAVDGGGQFGCSIDPTTEGLQQAAVVAADIRDGRVPMGRAADTMAQGLGQQQVLVEGINRDSALAWLIVEADRHMKQLALGEHPMPDGVSNYLNQIERHIKRGVPDDLLLRLWFTSHPMAARQSDDGAVVELAGRPIKLSGENELAMASGKRGHVTVDRRSQDFVADFNKHWASIRARYPVYGALESVYRSAAIAELVHRRIRGTDQPHERATKLIAQAFAAIASSDQHGFAPPRQVDTLAVSHTFRHGKRRHHVVIASGGVSVRPSQNLAKNIKTYHALSAFPALDDHRDNQTNRWWWNFE